MSFSISDNYRDGVKPEDIDNCFEEEGVMKMNENEIIEFLKQNKKKGIAFGFMPQEAKHWCEEHKDDTVFCVYLKNGWYESINIDRNDNVVYALPEDYEPKSQFKPHYEEFDIDGEGFFRIKKESYTYYCWFNWQKFLDDNLDKYNAFGGWLFKDMIWCTNPHLTTNLNAGDGGLTDYVSKDEKCEPVMPTKIRFWRHKE